MPDVTDTAQRTLGQASDHPVVERAARFGYGANGVMHLLLGFLILRLATGGAGSADQGGVLHLMSQNAFGKVLLVVGVIAWAGLALWQAGEACLSFYSAKYRIKAVAKAITYAALTLLCLMTLITGRSASSSGKNVSTSAKLMQHWWGVLLLVIVGLALIGVGIYHVIKGIRRKFLEDLQEHPAEWVQWAGIVGYALKGVALGTTGVLVLSAALTRDAKDAGGMDTAIRTLLDQPFGPIIVGLVGLGFIAYAVYSVARAQYAKV